MTRSRSRWMLLIATFLLMAGVMAPIADAQETSTRGDENETSTADGHGIDPADMDLTVDPADDFYEFANGGWFDRTEIPDNEASYGVFGELDDQVTETLIQLIGDIEPEQGTDEDLVAQLYAQAIDLDERADDGVDPLQEALGHIDRISTIEDAFQYQAQAPLDGIGGLFFLYGGPGFEDASVNIAWLGGPTLSLPGGSYYDKNDPSMDDVRDAWVETTAKLLMYIGYSEDDATAAAETTLDIETDIAYSATSGLERNDIQSYNNPRTLDELAEIVPEMDWNAYIDALGLTPDEVEPIYVDDIQFLESLSEIVSGYTVDDLKNLYTIQLIWAAAPYLAEEIGNVAFDFLGPVVSGVEERRPIEERALTAVEDTLPDALGQMYVAEAFGPEAKAAIEDLIDNLIDAFRIRIENSTWMSEETKAKAIEKLDMMSIKVGYPDRWASYDDVAIGDSLYETLNNATVAEVQQNLDDIGEPIDRDVWNAAAFDVNAYYNPLANEIVFPAAILQPPFFDPEADLASTLR